MAEKSIYQVAEVAQMLGFSRQTVIHIFEREAGVIILDRPGRLHKRKYRSIRIPSFVFERVRRKLSV